MISNIHLQIKKALLGHPSDIYDLGLRYFFGEDVKKDYHSAEALFTQSAELGFTKAQIHLALLYYEGYGLEKDLTKALFWFDKAAKNGNIWGQFYVEIMRREHQLPDYHTKKLTSRKIDKSINLFKHFSNHRHLLT